MLDLKSDKSASKISKEIFDLAKSCHTESEIPVIISGIVPRFDNLKGKAEAVNELLKRKCADSNLPFIDNNNIKENNVNRSKLHLNKSGSAVLEKNLLEMLRKMEL